MSRSRKVRIGQLARVRWSFEIHINARLGLFGDRERQRRLPALPRAQNGDRREVAHQLLYPSAKLAFQVSLHIETTTFNLQVCKSLVSDPAPTQQMAPGRKGPRNVHSLLKISNAILQQKEIGGRSAPGQADLDGFPAIPVFLIPGLDDNRFDADGYDDAIKVARERLLAGMIVKKLALAEDLAVWSDHAEPVRIALGRVVRGGNRHVEVKPVLAPGLNLYGNDIGKPLFGCGGRHVGKQAEGAGEQNRCNEHDATPRETEDLGTARGLERTDCFHLLPDGQACRLVRSFSAAPVRIAQSQPPPYNSFQY